MGHDESFIQKHTLLLGSLDARVSAVHEGQKAQTKLLESIDSRLRVVEMRSARNGLIAGCSAAVLVEMVKSSLGLGG